MNRTTYDQWLENTINLFEETEDGAKALEWMDQQDLTESFDDGLTPSQTYDKFVNGYFF